MSEQVVLITGGLTGIGRAAAVGFAKKGAKVVVSGRRDEAGQALVKELRAFGSEAEFINADVRKDVESNTEPNALARFDLGAETFQTWRIPAGGGVVRNMVVTTDGKLALAESGVNRIALASMDRNGDRR
jgi:NAD(P)-dependent dehydrogenase (short-subunit alcohol dehydrogenase family)